MVEYSQSEIIESLILTFSMFVAVRKTKACIANDEAKRIFLTLRHILKSTSN